MAHSDKIPFLDLVAPHAELKDELIDVFRNALDNAAFIGGPMVEQFERDFAAFCTTEHCVGVGSGTDALRFALIAAGIGPGDIVLTVPNTFIATTEAISQAGARPNFIDIDERTYNMDPRRLAAYWKTECVVDADSGELINRKLLMPVKAIVPVHLYGQTADMDPILELAERYRLVVIEDACQAHGAEYFSRRDNCWKKAGSMGKAAAFSFYPGKNLGACGEAGAVTTNDADLAQKVRMLRDHGQARKYYHELEGYNGRLDAIQAGILTVKLSHFPDWNAGRRGAAARYRQLFTPAALRDLAPFEPKWARRSTTCMSSGCGPGRPHAASGGGGHRHGNPLPGAATFAEGVRMAGVPGGRLSRSGEAAREIVSLPMFPQLTGEQQARVMAG